MRENPLDDRLKLIASFSGMRVLAWSDDLLYAARGYTLLTLKMVDGEVRQHTIATYRAPSWRRITSSMTLTFRLVRDGFHALAIHSAHLIAAVAGAIVALHPGETEFRVKHKVVRGSRPLHICAVPDGAIYFGEYFDNRERSEVHVYGSEDHGNSWNIAYTFPKGAIRHVHNIVYDRWQNCLWMLTGDNGDECRIMRASRDLKNIETVLSGDQQARAVALVPTADGIYFSSDTPLETNHIYHLDRSANLSAVSDLPSSSIYGCSVSDNIFFSTMVEPSAINKESSAYLFGRIGTGQWSRCLGWQKDGWHKGLFQYGNVMLPDGENSTDILAASTVAVKSGDLQTSLWRICR
jgi:hypothetical protein